MITFDLENSASRTAEYGRVRQDLKAMFGRANYHDFTKQACMVSSSRNAAAIRDRMAQKLGGDCNILVVRLRYGYAFRFNDRNVRTQAAKLLQSIPST